MTDDEARALEERQALRAKHTCIAEASSMHCLACNRGVPYPGLSRDEMADAMGKRPAGPPPGRRL